MDREAGKRQLSQKTITVEEAKKKVERVAMKKDTVFP